MSHVDTPSPITHVSLCAGYGGIDLGLKRAIPSLRTIAFSEIEAFACANLVSKMEAGLLDPAPIWTDLKTFPWSEFHGRVDILSGGYPCQPFSAAGKRLGAEDPRHLWPFIAAGIAAMRPSACFFENVEGHISLGLPDVIEDLAGLGYRTTWGVASASECGAPHQRKRVFILAYRKDERLSRWAPKRWQGQDRQEWREVWHQPFGQGDCGTELADSERSGLEGSWPNAGQSDESESWNSGASPWPSRPGQRQHDWEPPRVVGNAAQRQDHGRESRDMGFETGQGRCGDHAVGSAGEGLGNAEIMRTQGAWAEQQTAGLMQPSDAMGHTNSPRPQERPRQRGSAIQGADADGGATAERQTQPPLGRDADGPTHRLDHAVLHVSTDNRTDELRLLGNGVVPATAERAFRVLIGELMEEQI